MKNFLKKLLKNTLIAIGVVILLFASFVGLSFYSYLQPPPPITEEELEIANKIKSQLGEIGDSVRVSDIHPGDWLKVCAIYGSGLGDSSIIERVFGHSEDIELLNDTYPFITDHGNESAIIFVYPENKAEVFRITPQIMTYISPPEAYNSSNKSDSCVEKQAAYFEVLWNEKFRTTGTNPGILNKNYMKIKLVKREDLK